MSSVCVVLVTFVLIWMVKVEHGGDGEIKTMRRQNERMILLTYDYSNSTQLRTVKYAM